MQCYLMAGNPRASNCKSCKTACLRLSLISCTAINVLNCPVYGESKLSTQC